MSTVAFLALTAVTTLTLTLVRTLTLALTVFIGNELRSEETGKALAEGESLYYVFAMIRPPLLALSSEIPL